MAADPRSPDAAGTDAGRPEPTPTEPTHAERTRAEPGHAEPGRTGRTEPTGTESTPTEPGRAEPVPTELTSTGLTRTESTPTELGRPESKPTEPVSAEPGPTKLTSTGLTRTESTRTEPRRTEPVRAESGHAEPGRVEPARTLGLPTAISVVIGTVIGSGVFLVTAPMMRAVGSPAMVLAVWIFGGILTLFGALSYAELSAAMPRSGADYVYLNAAYGPLWGFIYGWTTIWVAKPGSIAALASAAYRYLAEFFPGLNHVFLSLPPPLGPGGGPLDIHQGQVLGAGLIIFFSAINILGTRFGGLLQVTGAGLKVTLIAGIILCGLATRYGNAANFHSSVSVGAGLSHSGGMAGFFIALVAALWAYDGWTNTSMIASEIQNPEKNLPRALFWGTLAVIGIYLLANVSYLYVLSAPEIAGSQRVAADMMRRVAGQWGAAVVSVAAIVSMLAAINGLILSGSRVPFAMAQDGYFFAWAGRLSTFQTPAASVALQAAWSVVLLASGRFEDLINMVIFTEWILYGMTTVGVLVLRRTRPDMLRPYRVWGYPLVPVAFVLVAMALLFATLRESPRESIMGLVLIITGLPFYYYWNVRKGASAESSSAPEGKYR